MSTPSVLTANSGPQKSWLERARGLVGLIVLAPFAIVGLLSTPPAPVGSIGELEFNAIGWIVFVAGAAFRLWATLYIGGRKGKVLATEGPYSICRNPLYLGNFLMTVSVAIFMQSAIFAVGIVIASLLYLTVTVASEERRLGERLGETYAQYCREVPRFLPRISHFRTPPTIEVDIHCLWIECLRAARWVWIPILCEVLLRLRMEAWWPHW